MIPASTCCTEATCVCEQSPERTTRDRLTAIRKRLASSSPFSPFYADVKFLLKLVEKT